MHVAVQSGPVRNSTHCVISAISDNSVVSVLSSCSALSLASARSSASLKRYNQRFMIVARRFLISGRVQGVGFRMFAAARAAAEGVHGYIKNLPDGRVEALVEGDEESVDR